jgi:hypothetical protein
MRYPHVSTETFLFKHEFTREFHCHIGNPTPEELAALEQVLRN